jgi:aspartyl-tRNA(Asn)/glutamyl-tRNA(Gln) amidotransferase subunit A
MTDDIWALPIAELRSRLIRGDVSCIRVAAAFLERIAAFDKHLNCFVRRNEDLPEDARQRDESGDFSPPLAGVPLAVKDLFLTRGLPTTAGSRAPHEFSAADRDAEVVRRLRRSGGLLIGKTTLHEFAFGITNENEHFGPTRNPWNPAHMSGGSSGGSAVAVAARMCCGALGTDTRGSVRIPAACCGVAGLKPTFGLLPTDGVVPLSPTLDHVGLLASSVDDLTEILSALAPRFRRSLIRASEAEVPVLGYAPYYFRLLDDDVERAVRAAMAVFVDAGLPVEEVEIPELDEALVASDVISRAEAVTLHHRQLRETPHLYGERVRQRLLTGYDLTARDLVLAHRQRERLVKAFRRVFRRVDCLAAPTLPVAAPAIDTTEITIAGATEGIVPCFVRLAAPQNMAGIPALSVPCGFSSRGLPFGLQLMAWRGGDARVLRLGALFQRLTDWHRRTPPASV